MANAVFTTKVRPVYDDLPEQRYHFPKTYLNKVNEAVGDLIVYYEPRREDADLAGRGGRQVYFATARVDRVERDPARTGFYYAYVTDYLEFVTPVPFRIGRQYLESTLQKFDGSTNKGSFGRSVRIVPPLEFQAILSAGFGDVAHLGNEPVGTIQESPLPFDRLLKRVVGERLFRDAAFTRVIRANYSGRCAMTGMRIVDDDGHHETEAAHIRPVAERGPDSPRNGIALSRTIHWMFDAGILSVSEGDTIMMVERLVPAKIRNVLNSDLRVQLPSDPSLRPHPEFLRYHRNVKFKGN
jgi:putative restriction endonuclease